MYRYENIRNFYFENEKGEKIDCQKVDGNLFFFNVSGLGYEEEIEYEQIGHTFIENKRKMKQNQITGDIEFYNMTYDEYTNFINFILYSKKLKIIYVPKKTIRTEYYRDINLVSIAKSEEDEYNILTCPIVIDCKTLWYEKNETIYNITKQSNEIRWDFKWDSKFSNYNNRAILFENKGHVEAPFLLEIEGIVINPSILVLEEGKIIYSLKLEITINPYEKLFYSTRDEELFLYKQKTDGTKENLFDYLDINNQNFFKLPMGVSEIRLSAQNDITKAKLTIYPQYKAV